MSDAIRSKNTPLYAQGGYDRELNYKLWSTCKSRFNAAARLQKKHHLSTWAVALLSSYVMIFSQITIMLPQFSQGATGQIILFISSSLSIVILVVSQLEASENYSVRSHTFHQSGLDIAELYKRLRLLKSTFEDKKNKKFIAGLEEISNLYNDILQRSDNHADIDFDIFKASKPDYEDHKLTPKDVSTIQWRLFSGQYLFYYVCMWGPPLFFALFALITWPKTGIPAGGK